MTACIARARRAWEAAGRAGALDHRIPDDVGRFQAPEQEMALAWLRGLAGADRR